MTLRDDCLYRLRTAFAPIPKQPPFILVVDDISLKVLTEMFSMFQVLQMGVSTIQKLSLLRKSFKKVQVAYLIDPSSSNAILKDFANPDSPQYESIHIFTLTAIPHSVMEEWAACYALTTRLKTLKELNLSFVVRSLSEVKLSADNNLSVETESTLNELVGVVVSGRELGAVNIHYDKEAERVAVQLQKRLEGMIATFDRMKNAYCTEKAEPTSIVVLSRQYDYLSPLIRDFHYKPLLYEIIKVENNQVTTDKHLLRENDQVFKKYKKEHLFHVLQGINDDLQAFNSKSKVPDKNKEMNVEEMSQVLKIMPNFLQMKKCFQSHLQFLQQITKVSQQSNMKNITMMEQTAVLGTHEDGKKPSGDFLSKYISMAQGQPPQEQARLAAIALLSLQLKPNEKNDLTKLLQTEYKKLIPLLAKIKTNKRFVPKRQKDNIALDRFQSKVEETLKSIVSGGEQAGIKSIRVSGVDSRVNRSNSKTSNLGRKKITNEPQEGPKPRLIVVVMGAMGYNEVYAMEQFEETHQVILCTHHYVTPQEYLSLLLNTPQL